jgi:hypothetical protein
LEITVYRQKLSQAVRHIAVFFRLAGLLGPNCDISSSAAAPDLAEKGGAVIVRMD